MKEKDFQSALDWCGRVEILAKAINANHEFVENLPAIRFALQKCMKDLNDPTGSPTV